MYKIYSVQDKISFGEVVGKPHYALVKTIISEYIKENNIILEELYYPTYLGMGRVYSENIYKPAVESFLEKHHFRDLTQVYKSKEGKEFKFVLIEKRV